MNARQTVNFTLGLGAPIMLTGFLFGYFSANWILAAGVSFGTWAAFPVAILIMRIGARLRG